ncbi:MAG: CRISPR-associated CARF protein Csa3 [Candidatus Diapherotrites archaeon]
MANVLISTIYSVESIVLAITRFSIDRVFLLVSDEYDENQHNALKQIKDNYAKVIEVKEKKIPQYDIVSITEKCVELIDAIPTKDKIIINITPARKTQSIGLLYAAYKRAKFIDKIIYICEDKKEIVVLPILEFYITETQQQILENIRPEMTLSELAEKLKNKQSKAMLYKNIKELREKGYIEDKNGLSLTDAGKIAKL